MLAMAIETLGEACSQGWRVTVRCAYGRSEGPRSQSSRECNYRKELDMETLVWTRGRAFPLSRLESRLRCPRCGSRYVVVLYEPPRRRAVGALNFSLRECDSGLDSASPIMLLTLTLLKEGAFREGTFEGRSRGGARARKDALRSRAALGHRSTGKTTGLRGAR
jgi:DNA-directed RNA polymerase subunit RPC12/RpoP